MMICLYQINIISAKSGIEAGAIYKEDLHSIYPPSTSAFGEDI
jgi:hypothetical protein